MSENEERPKLPLKNGSEVDARSAYVKWRMLEAEQHQHPENVKSLLALARGQASSVLDETVSLLRKRFVLWFAPDGALTPLVRDVLISAYRDTPEGPVIVSPFRLTNQHQLDLVADIQRQDLDLFRRRFRDSDDEPPGKSRR